MKISSDAAFAASHSLGENHAGSLSASSVSDRDEGTGSVLTRSTPSKSTPNRRIHPIDRSKVDPKMLKAAEGMEAMFLDYMMKVMRETVPKNEMDLESPATQIYRGMMDSEVSQKAARAGGIGLADLIVAYLDSQRYNLKQGVRAAGAYAAGEKTATPSGSQTQRDEK